MEKDQGEFSLMKYASLGATRKHLHKVLRVKQIVRRNLVKLPYVEKIRRVIEMQRLASKFKRDPTRHIYIWNI